MKSNTATLKIGKFKIKLNNAPAPSYTPTEIDHGNGTSSLGLGLWEPIVLKVDGKLNETVRQLLSEEYEFILEEPDGKEMLVKHGAVLDYNDEQIKVAVKWGKLLYSEI